MLSLYGPAQRSSCWRHPRPRGLQSLQGRYPATPAALQPRMHWGLSSKGRTLAHSASSSQGEDLSLEEEQQDVEEAPEHHEQFRVLAAGKDLDTLMQQFERGDINLSPRYQRQYVWPFPKASRLVESVFADLFIPPIVPSDWMSIPSDGMSIPSGLTDW